MKKILIALLLACTTNMFGQQVYTEIKEKAQAVVNDANANPLLKQISRFKIDALDYMAMKMREQMPDSTANYLDRQAFAMNNFVSYYIQKLIENRTQPNAFQVKIIEAFMDASFSNPLFNDPDKELTLAYFSDGNSLTRFSLDTDWRRAVLAAKELVRLAEEK